MNPDIWHISSAELFNAKAVEIFQYQHKFNAIYRRFCDLMKVDADAIEHWKDIPFLPIQLFKQERVLCSDQYEITFESSGTGGETSKHYVQDQQVYVQSFQNGFTHHYGNVSEYCFCCLLPSYLERSGSSLVYMAESFVNQTRHNGSDFFLHDFEKLHQKLLKNRKDGIKTILLGVSFALLDFTEQYQIKYPELIVMETGGMKGRRKELTREVLHAQLTRGFGVDHIHSEYGMTELLSQAYAKENGRFFAPPWMKTIIREVSDPKQYIDNRTGVINVIDLANVHSCAFIATQDLGKTYDDGSFEVLGRLDNTDIRGCNLMVSNV